MDSINDSLPLEAVERLDQLADQFETEFAQGNAPCVIEFAKRLPDYSDHAVIELIRLEAELRRTSGATVELSDFLRRYPEHPSQVASALTLDAHRGEQTSAYEAGKFIGEQDGAPERIGRYEIVRLVGEGGYGFVYQAHDTQLGRLVAAKVPRYEQFNTPEKIELFVSEARTAASLKHPQLVSVYDVLIDNGLVCIVQEFVDGTSLKHWARENRQSPSDLVDLFVQICRPLEYLHEQGFAHCDLKLENVLIDRMGLPHVADFGMAIKAKVLPRGRGSIFGTPVMMAPEQVRGEVHRIDARTDVWALGGHVV
jgi:predicted Ser/Thr protein kinase